jgi:hypothetical protein
LALKVGGDGSGEPDARRFNQMNLSTYLCAPVLYDALGRLKSVRASQGI